MPNLALLAFEASDGVLVVLTAITLVSMMLWPCAPSSRWNAEISLTNINNNKKNGSLPRRRPLRPRLLLPRKPAAPAAKADNGSIPGEIIAA